MKLAIVSLTEKGRKLSKKIAACMKDSYCCTRYAFEKYTDGEAIPFSRVGALTGGIFSRFDGILYLCACGIAVRAIAPYLVSKTTDPAVVAVDEQGKFAVSLLSGHLGGANALAGQVASLIGGVAVITTATDAGKLFSPDSFAKANHLHIGEMDMAKEAAAAVVNGEKLGFYSDYPYKNLPEAFLEAVERVQPGDKTDLLRTALDKGARAGMGSRAAGIGICISADSGKHPFARTLHLTPKNIVLGAGCKKNTPPEEFDAFIKGMLSRHHIPLWRVAALHSIDKKKEEQALLQFGAANGIPVRFYSPQDLMAVEGEFASSSFVKETVGVDNVCERSAVIEGGALIVRKQAESGMTFAAAERPVEIDFNRS